MNGGDMVAAIAAGRLEFAGLLGRPARMADPADEARQLQADEAAELEAAELAQADELAPAAAEVAPAVQLQAPTRRKVTARRQPLAPLAPLNLADGF